MSDSHRNGAGTVKEALFTTLRPEKRGWLNALELRRMHPDLNTRSLYPALTWHVVMRTDYKGQCIKRRQNSVTRRWEYALGKSKPREQI